MSFINRIITQAKAYPAPTEVVIRPQDVGPLANHVRQITFTPKPDYEVRETIVAGRLKILGVPVRVLQ